jgi:hypothetical protein
MTVSHSVFMATAGAIRAVTPNDNTDLPDGPTAGLLIGGAGNVAVIDSSGSTQTFPAQNGQIIPLCVTRVKSTNTTATSIFAFY